MSKTFTMGYNYEGKFETLQSAVKKAIQQMNLNINNENISTNSFRFEVAEKMKWLSTNWPVKFQVEAQENNGKSTLILRGGSTLTSLTQEINNQAKVKEFLELVKLYAPAEKPDAGQEKDIERIPCPRCGEMIAKTAKLCRFCRSEL